MKTIRKSDGFDGQKSIVLGHETENLLKKDPITQLLYITSIGYYPRAKGHFRRREEGTADHILIYCEDGEGWFEVNGTKAFISKNEYFIIECGKPHTYGASDNNPWSIYWFHFSGDKSYEFVHLFNSKRCIEQVPSERLDDRFQLFEEIYQNLSVGNSTDTLRYASLSLLHLIGSFAYIDQFREIKKIKEHNPFEKAVDYLRKNIQKKITVQELAAHLHQSEANLTKMFRLRTGMTPINYFIHMKIQEACRYLEFTNKLIKEIAFDLGFFDQFYFSRIFAKYMGISPNEYKKNKRA